MWESLNASMEEGWRQKQRQRSSHLFGGAESIQILVDLVEKVEFILFFQIDRCKTASASRHRINSAPRPPPPRHDDHCFCRHPPSMKASHWGIIYNCCLLKTKQWTIFWLIYRRCRRKTENTAFFAVPKCFWFCPKNNEYLITEIYLPLC